MLGQYISGVSKKSLGSKSNEENWVVSESGLYCLIIRSNLPEAKVFRKWVTGEVLPAIRKTGAYVVKSCGKSNYICRSTQWRYDNGLLPKTTIEERHGDFDDIRDIAFSYVEILNKPVRTVEYEDEDYFSIMDIKKALRITTDTSSIADSLCINKPFARKLFVFGSTSPAWFCTREGLRLLLSNKAKTNYCQYLDKLLKKGGM
jgi:prophage antirepressor-like protein